MIIYSKLSSNLLTVVSDQRDTAQYSFTKNQQLHFFSSLYLNIYLQKNIPY